MLVAETFDDRLEDRGTDEFADPDDRVHCGTPSRRKGALAIDGLAKSSEERRQSLERSERTRVTSR